MSNEDLVITSEMIDLWRTEHSSICRQVQILVDRAQAISTNISAALELKRLLVNRPVDQWQPWSTAPKTGELILVFFEDGRMRLARWEPHADSSYPFAWKNEHSETIIREWHRDEYFTHWMPLPKFPCIPPTGLTFAKHQYEHADE